MWRQGRTAERLERRSRVECPRRGPYIPEWRSLATPGDVGKANGRREYAPLVDMDVVLHQTR